MSNRENVGQESGGQRDSSWSDVSDLFTNRMDLTAKGYVRTRIMHQQLMEHLPLAPATVLDIGGGAGHQSFLLAEAGYEVTLLDQDPEMLAKAKQRREMLPDVVRQKIDLVHANGAKASAAVGNDRFNAVLSHGVLMYQDRPDEMVAEICKCSAPDGIVSIMTGNQKTLAISPALKQNWDDALTAFDTDTEIGVLGVPTRSDTVEGIESLLQTHNVRSLGWYGLWLFSDLLEIIGTEPNRDDWDKLLAVEMRASRTDPYRQMSRAFHLIGRKA